MPGSTSRRDQHEDPRDNTVDLPRIDVDGLTKYFRRAAPMLEPEPAGLLEPLPEPEPAGLLDPLPEQDSEPAPASRHTSESQSYLTPDSEPSGGLRHPYAEPDEPRPSAWPAVDSKPTPPVDGEPAPVVGGEPSTAPPGEPEPAAARESTSSSSTRHRPVQPAETPIAAASAGASGARDRSHVTGPGSRPPAGSHADLRSRLGRLPDGHPSSPYEDDGHARALPIRLKQLELGLPAPSREIAGGSVPESGATDNAEHLATEASAPSTPDTIPAAAEPAAEVDSGLAGLPGSRPAQPEWSDPYATRDTGNLAPTSAPSSDPRADLTLGPWRATPSRRMSGLEGLTPRGGNGHGSANGHGNGSARRDSPAEPDRPDRAPADADRRDTAEYRIPDSSALDLRDLAERTLATSRTAEGRNVFGSYGSSGLTPMMQRIAAHLPVGGLAPGSEANSLKSSERLTAKFARLVTRNPGRTAEELAATVGDVVRYAFAFETLDYVEGTWLVHRRLKSHGFELELRRNRWESPEYKGIFTQWRDPAHHIAFEVQFHTTASWAVVQRTHEAYIQITDPATPSAERAVLRARQVAAAAAAKAPLNAAELGDFRLEAR
jgi:hypothetical protein